MEDNEKSQKYQIKADQSISYSVSTDINVPLLIIKGFKLGNEISTIELPTMGNCGRHKPQLGSQVWTALYSTVERSIVQDNKLELSTL